MDATCAVIGHRAGRFPWKYQENNSGCKRLKRRLREQMALLYGGGVRRFYVGGALGVDLWAGESLLRLREEPGYAGAELAVVLPYEGHDAGWDERSRRRIAFLCRHSAQVIVAAQAGDPHAAYERSGRYMAERADCLLAVYDGEPLPPSGVGRIVRYAQRMGKPIRYIHPDTAAVTGALFWRPEPEGVGEENNIRQE